MHRHPNRRRYNWLHRFRPIRLLVLLLVSLTLTLLLNSGTSASFASAPSAQLGTAIANQARRIDRIERAWRSEYSDYFGITADVPQLEAEQIAVTLSQLTQETQHRFGVIYVLPQSDYLELALVTSGHLSPLQDQVPVPKSRLQQVVNEFKRQILHPDSGNGYLESAQQLYQWIIAPIEPELQQQQIDTLIFCAGQSLRSLPFAALHDGKQFLVEKFSLGLIPAFNLVDLRHRPPEQRQVLAMGASEFASLDNLPAVPLELSAIAEDFPGVQIFLNQDFTLRNLQRQLNTKAFPIVHLATHAEFRPGAPEHSYIQLWQNEQLTLDRVRQLGWNQLPVELLVLSACQTAIGDAEAELGFAGFSYQSGVKSTLASLWSVSDVGTLALMREFYGQLISDRVTTKAEALRNAQLAMLTGQIKLEAAQLQSSRGVLPLPANLTTEGDLDLTHPFYWAAFVLVGSPW